MGHLISQEDQEFKRKVESCEFPVSEFDHRAHIRLAYVYLAKNKKDTSIKLMRDALICLLQHASIEPSQKYHETLTAAWVLAIHYFMVNTDDSKSADDFIEKNNVVLDSELMMTHYSGDVLFSEQARIAFVEPDLKPIPKCDV